MANTGRRLRQGAVVLGTCLLIALGWCLLMAGYLFTYDAFENRAVPVMLPPRSFSIESWNSGYFLAQGSLRNDLAVEAGDRRNGLYFHVVLVVTNIAYFGLAIWLWRRRVKSRSLDGKNLNTFSGL